MWLNDKTTESTNSIQRFNYFENPSRHLVHSISICIIFIQRKQVKDYRYIHSKRKDFINVERLKSRFQKEKPFTHSPPRILLGES